eukprot:COSAG01_NODE_2991_length_6744_cov_251.630248_4_plen_99_part_00
MYQMYYTNIADCEYFLRFRAACSSPSTTSRLSWSIPNALYVDGLSSMRRVYSQRRRPSQLQIYGPADNVMAGTEMHRKQKAHKAARGACAHAATRFSI